MMTDEKTKEAPAGADPKKIVPDEKSERPVLGKIKTDEEARLAAEIEKLRS